MIKIDRQHHKITRTSPTWGPWEYEYHERRCQIRKARELMGRPPEEGSQHGK